MNGAATSRVSGEPNVGAGVYVGVFAILIPLAFAGVGLQLDRTIGGPMPPVPSVLRGLGSALAIVGLATLSNAVFLLRSVGRGAPISSSPPSRLVSSGAYRWSRHPIYLGTVLIFLGLALLFGSFWSAAVAAPAMGFFYFAYGVGVEEPVLRERHGEAYRKYQSRTPLVMPFPFRGSLTRGMSGWLGRVSARINRPWISRRRDHLLFWGYGVWPGLGVGVGLAMTELILLGLGTPSTLVAATICLATLGGLGGAYAVWMIEAWLGEGIPMWEASRRVGFTSWGVLLGVVLVLTVAGRMMGLSPVHLLDATIPSLMIAHPFGRIGCAVYGCCYGRETDTPLALSYRHPALKAVREGLVDPSSLRPVQLLSALNGTFAAIVIFGAWTVVELAEGTPIALTFVLYGSFRMGEEWLRARKTTVAGLFSSHQIAAAMLLAVGLLVLHGIGTVPDASRYLSLRELTLGSPEEPLLLFALVFSGGLTTLVFSYHRESVGRWR